MGNEKFKYVDPEKAFICHPNVLAAYLRYMGDPKKFLEDMRQGKNGHNDEFDEYMRRQAEAGNMRMAARGDRFPPRPIKKKAKK